MPHLLLGAQGSGTLVVAICTLLFILPSAFSGLPRRMYSSQQVANLQASHTDSELRALGNFSGHSDALLDGGASCSNRDISVFQGYEGLVDGIPQYSVQISNNCPSCDPWDIHVFCGWFASARLVNSNRFKRIWYDDCLVNGGRALRYGEVLTFAYANTRMYPIRLKSARFCR